MKTTWKPTTAGIVNIICGFLFLIGGLGVLAGIGSPASLSWTGYVMHSFGHGSTVDMSLARIVVSITSALLIIPGIISIIGGFYATRRRLWIMALAGSIPTVMYLAPVGFLSVILTALSRKEFRKGGNP